MIISTEQGEAPILLKDIDDIQFDDPAQNFLQLGRSREALGRFGEALAYYEKALEVNPDLEEAKKLANGVKNRYWAQSTQGPKGEVERQQLLHDAWDSGRSMQKLIDQRHKERAKVLRDGLGITIERSGDWVRLAFVDPKMEAGLLGLKRKDRLVSIDGESLRYLSAEVVAQEMTEPRFSNFTLEYDRDISLRSDGVGDKGPRSLGFRLKLENVGLVLDSVKQGGAADRSSLKKGDLLVQVNGKTTRYMSAKDVEDIVRRSGDRVVFTVRRSALLMRR